jgi:branched-chain amino acid transport system substrate-binding protein
MLKNKQIIVILSLLIVGIVAAGIMSYIYLHAAKGQTETIKIGVTLPLSGKYAYTGEAAANGLKLASEEINSQGGINNHKIQLIIEDNKGETKDAVNSVNKFVSVDQVGLVFSTFTNITSAVKQIVFDNEKFLFYMSTVPDFAKENKYAFRDYFDASENGAAIAQAIAKQGYKRIAYLTEISDQCKRYEQGFNKEAEKLGLQVVSREEYPLDQTDLKTNLLKLNIKNSQALVACTWRHEDILMKQLKELDLIAIPSFHIVAPYLPAANTAEMKKIYEENKAVSSWYGISEVTNKEEQLKFQKKYRANFGKDPIADAAYAYDDIYILAEALKACDVNFENKDCLAKYLTQIKYDGIGGHLEFNQDRSSQRDVFLIKVVNGQWQEN